MNLRSLAETSRKGRPAVEAAQPFVDAALEAPPRRRPSWATTRRSSPTTSSDRNFAVERDPRSPGGRGYTGFEALLQYFYDQALSINTFDANGYILKVNLFVSECTEYQNRRSLRDHMKEDPEFYKRCAAILGPNQPGITQADPTFTGAQEKRENQQNPERRIEGELPHPPSLPGLPTPPASNGQSDRSSAAERRAERRERRRRARARERLRNAKDRGDALSQEMRRRLEETLGIELPESPSAPLPEPARRRRRSVPQGAPQAPGGDLRRSRPTSSSTSSSAP